MQVILLNYPDIDGEVMLPGDYAGLIAVDSVSIKSASKDSSSLSPSGYGDDVETERGESGYSDQPKRRPLKGDKKSAPSSSQLGVDSITLTKSVDAATPLLLGKAFESNVTAGVTAQILILRTQEQVSDGSGMSMLSSVMANSVGVSLGATPTVWHKPFLTITLEDAHITGADIDLDKDSMKETVTISFKTLTMKYIVYKNGQQMGTVSSGAIKLTNPD